MRTVVYHKKRKISLTSLPVILSVYALVPVCVLVFNDISKINVVFRRRAKRYCHSQNLGKKGIAPGGDLKDRSVVPLDRKLGIYGRKI